MLCGGEPLACTHFFDVAERLGAAGVKLKIETNGQRFDSSVARRLAALPIRSIQVSLDGDTQAVYERQRLGGSLARAHAACRAVRDAGLPLEVTFAPTRVNIHEAEAVIERSRALGAFRFNTGALMRIGNAARHWARLEPTSAQYRELRAVLARQAAAAGGMELCHEPFTVSQALDRSVDGPPATLLVLPNGWVKIAAALPDICADLRRSTLREAWNEYRDAWHRPATAEAVHGAIADEVRHGQANAWRECLTQGDIDERKGPAAPYRRRTHDAQAASQRQAAVGDPADGGRLRGSDGAALYPLHLIRPPCAGVRSRSTGRLSSSPGS
jgi:MoaA/NifB/PqqE/SkfB family radical SAM enzyme